MFKKHIVHVAVFVGGAFVGQVAARKGWYLPGTAWVAMNLPGGGK